MSNHTDMLDKYCGDCCDIHPIQSQYTKVAAVGRHHKRGGAAFGRATSFVVSFVLALNRVNILAVTTILVLYVGHGQYEHVRLEIMFVRIETSRFLAVRAMRACAQGRIQGPCLHARGLKGVRAPQGSGGFGGSPNPPILKLKSWRCCGARGRSSSVR